MYTIEVVHLLFSMEKINGECNLPKVEMQYYGSMVVGLWGPAN